MDFNKNIKYKLSLNFGIWATSKPRRTLTQSCIMHCVNAVLFLFILYFIHDSANYDFVNLRSKLSYQYVCTPKLEFPKLNFCDIAILTLFAYILPYTFFLNNYYLSVTD